MCSLTVSYNNALYINDEPTSVYHSNVKKNCIYELDSLEKRFFVVFEVENPVRIFVK